MIEIKNAYKIYNKDKQNQVNALDGVNLTINQGEMISITGRSGAGKSTLLHIIGCLDNITEGSYMLKGIDVSKLSDGKLSKIRNKEIGIVMQDYALIQSETALQNVMIPLYFCKCSLKKMKEDSLDALSKVGVSDLNRRKVNSMSGGQKQRVAIARAIVNKPSLVLADEPTGALDSKTSDEIMHLLKELNKTGVSIITVTHDEKVSKYSDRIITINDGRIINE